MGPTTARSAQAGPDGPVRTTQWPHHLLIEELTVHPTTPPTRSPRRAALAGGLSALLALGTVAIFTGEKG